MSTLSPEAERFLEALNDLAGESLPDLAREVIQTLTLREMAIIIAWRDGARGMEPEHGALTVTFAGETVSSEFTRKSRGALQMGKRKK